MIKLPSSLAQEADSLGADDWLIVQPSGSSLLKKIKGAVLAVFASASPSALGTASAGTAKTVSRGDHVHPLPDADDVGALPAAGGTLTGDVNRTNGAHLAAPGTSSTVPHYAFDGDTDTGIGHSAANSLQVITGGTARISWGGAGNTVPAATNTYNLGSAAYVWETAYFHTSPTITSGRDAKTDIVASDLGLGFILSLAPKSYRLKVGRYVEMGKDIAGNPVFIPSPGVRRHYGLIAQDVEAVCRGRDFAGVVRDTDNGEYGLRYDEFIAPIVAAIQELASKIQSLDGRLAVIEAETTAFHR